VMTGRTGKTALLFLAFWVSAHISFCAEIEVKSVVTPTKVSIGDYVQIKVTITGPDAGKAEDPVLQPMPDFTMLGRPSYSYRANMVNLQVSVSKTYTYMVKPKKTGTFVIGAVTVRAGGRKFSAPGTRIEVVAGKVPGTGNSSPSPRDTAPRRSRSGDGGIFIKSYVDNDEPYVGQQITHTFELYYQLTLLTDTEYMPPSTTGFWSVELPQVQPMTKIVNGRIYNHKAIKTALFPTTSGELTIGEAALTYSYGGFFSPVRTRTLKTEPITIRVKPLPEEGRPDDFKGAVGKFSIAATCDKEKVEVGDVVTVKVTVSGVGNLDLITELSTPDFSDFKTYDPRVAETLSNSGFTVGGGKTWDFVLSPRNQGRTTIGSFSLSYFDPEDEAYHTVSTEPLSLLVTPGGGSMSADSSPEVSRKGIETIASDIRYIKPDRETLETSDRRVYGSLAYYLLYVLPTCIFMVAFAVKKRRDAIERDTGLKRRLNAWKQTQRRLAEAEELLDKGEKRDFFGKLSEAAVEYIGDSLNLDTASLTTEALEQILLEKGIPGELTKRVRKNLELCDFFRFSSNDSGAEARGDMLEDTRAMITELREKL